LRRAALPLLLGLLLGAAATGAGAAPAIRWQGLQEGLEAGRREGKVLLISFTADWCTSCERMDRETFRDPRVVDFLNSRFIPVRVDTDRDPKASADFGVKGLPDLWFVYGAGTRIAHRPGFVSADIFLKVLRSVLAEKDRMEAAR